MTATNTSTQFSFPGAERKTRIRSMNDHVRRTFTGGRVMLSADVAALEPALKAKVLLAVREFTDFNEDNDPHKEHDCAIFEVDGEQYMFQFSYYDKRLEYGSDDPSDEMKTCRVLTIMTPSER